MLIDYRILSKNNPNLTPESLKWVLKNALHLGIDDLRDLKAQENATHPLLRDESIYDDVPVDALGPFVMEPYFPRKHFNRAFAGLFGKTSIAEITADDFSYYEELIERNECYTIGIHDWMRLPFTRDEYDHLYTEFSRIFVGPKRIQAYVCQHGLLRNSQLTLDIFEKESKRDSLRNSLHADSCSELANFMFDSIFSEFNSLHADKQNKPDFSKAMDMLKYPLQFTNLSRDRRDAVLSFFGAGNFNLTQIHQPYNKAIPDDVLNVLLPSNHSNSADEVAKGKALQALLETNFKGAHREIFEPAKIHKTISDDVLNVLLPSNHSNSADEVAKGKALQALLEINFKGAHREGLDPAKIHKAIPDDVLNVLLPANHSNSKSVDEVAKEKALQALLETNFKGGHLESLNLAQIHQIYNKAIPDDVFDVLLAGNRINSESVDEGMGIISDSRLSLKLATQIALSSPGKHAIEYFQRHDVDEVAREKVLHALLETELKGAHSDSSSAIRALSKMISSGMLTLPELERVQDEHHDDMRNIIFEWSESTGIALPPAIQDRWVKDGFCTGTQLRNYHDLSVVVDSIKVMYTGASHREDGSTRNLENLAIPAALFNTRWTRELLLELLDVCMQTPNGASQLPPHRASQLREQETLREDIFKKLFGESFYPSLDREDLTGPYGRAENLLARLLDSDAHLLSEFDANLIARSGIQLTYCDEEVNLATSLAHHPELNEQIIAERLRLRVEQLNDNPAPTLARQRPAL